MKILAIETSCDETAIALLEFQNKSIRVLGNKLLSQVKIHEQYGGVFPMIAKREHAKALTPLLKEVLKESSNYNETKTKKLDLKLEKKVRKILEREEGLADELLELFSNIKKPKIDYIGVTAGPGLEPALWVGINFAKALALILDVPLYPINHMEGHILSGLIKPQQKKSYSLEKFSFPTLSLLISGGHTELVLSKKFGNYKIIGKTRDDAVGEAFDKVARMMELPYPGGPQISRLAEEAREEKLSSSFTLPRPMLTSKDFDFSFSGLKTAVLYLIKKLPQLTTNIKKEIALEFENAVTEVLVEKTKKAILKTDAKTLIIGGGVSANKNIRYELTQTIRNNFKEVSLFIPEQKMSTDNALMIALSTYQKIKSGKKSSSTFSANGNLSL